VVPGILESIRLYWVPYVVQFDNDYKQGKLDALVQSRRLSLGKLGIITVYLIITLVLSIVPRLWLDAISGFKQPVLFVVLFLGTMSMELYCNIVLFALYEKLFVKVKAAH